MPRAPRKRKKTAAGVVSARGTATLHHRDTPRFRKLNALLARHIRSLRHARGITIEQASEAAGVCQRAPKSAGI